MIDFGVLSDGVEDKDADHEYPPVNYPIPETMPAVRDPFDPAPLLKLFDKYHAQVDRMEAVAAAFVVSDEATAAQANEYMLQSKKLASVTDKERKDLKEPYLKVTQPLDNLVKNLNDRLIKKVHDVFAAKIRPYLQEKERKRIEAQRKAEADARALQARLDAEEAEKRRIASEKARLDALIAGAQVAEAESAARAAAAMVEPAPVVVAQVVQDETKTTTENGTVGLKKEWAFEIFSFRDLPNECLLIRREEIIKAVSPWVRAQISAGIRNIPGVKVYEQTVVKTRTK